ncbi:phosphoribosylanthranilate isomerase [Bacteroides helcogenes]|uniref:N-(5'-phosphoribosyl)anthranilate isomerase n=1 Tax=Bacteroides helcogenes (strain ATCC 35417 / DSM 20613 / JCM 6297 / CCUG 15421 / P 36-108) TaxID=693979 RepID=E6SQU7_BACT6|nr:phosphoribosylanthranilate isomerase [Bacteroides helcogenes]ADV44030.1 phosphoribosylanthranilate isomerase [Bacteroides helcogenes P 36-108]MDY5237853.1 phosphoribosylanthranilate isomerase [Bacteroides helcogenes]
MNNIIKVCGMTNADNIRNVERLGIDMIGFIFYPKSPRCLCEIPDYLPVHAKRVGVFVNESKDNVLMYADRFGLDCVQLHGSESPEYCRSLRNDGMRLIKAFPISHPKDLLAVSAYNGLCDYYLFDTKTPQYGGSGSQFDWNLLNRYNGTTPFLLSGGINPYSAKAIREFHHFRFAGIDLNSRFETAPGIKDVERIRQFLEEYKKINYKSYEPY